MFSKIKVPQEGNHIFWKWECACLEDDDKETEGVPNGSECYEMDTGKVYLFDEENSQWLLFVDGSSE